ncbi:MAG: hypothetical protein Pars2KO_05170 [Parasphingorhabdus sp.]
MDQGKKPAAGVSLAHVDDFPIGAAQVSPSNCEVRYQNENHSLQPRVMQVLVLLSSLEGRVATKEELIQNCWDGAAVSDDVITRCISQLRSLAKTTNGDIFTIKTVPRVGYTLIPNENFEAKAVPESLPSEDSENTSDEGKSSARFSPAFLLLALVLIVPFSIWAWSHFSKPAEWRLESVKTLAPDPEVQSHPAVSPDGKFIIYSSDRGSENRDLWMRPFGGGEPTRLTTHPDIDHLVSYAPGGNQIAFIRSAFGEQASPCRIIVKDLRNGAENIVGRCKKSSFGLSTPAWSKDEQSLYISEAVSDAKDATLRLVQLDLESGKREVLTEPAPTIRGDFDPKISPDGNQLIFNRAKSLSAGNLFLLNLSDRSTIALTTDNQFRPAIWTPDGNEILTVSSDERDGITTFSKSGKLIGKQSSGLLDKLGRISRSGNLIAAETPSLRAVLVDKRGDAESEVVAVEGMHEYPTLSRNGQLAFTTLDRKGTILWVSENGEKPRRLTDLPRISALSWSPDGTKIAYASAEDAYLGIFELSSERKVQLPWKNGPVGSIAWSPDGRDLIFAAGKDAKSRLWRIPADGNSPAAQWSDTGWWAVRSNSTAIFASRGDQAGIWKMSDSGKPLEQIEDSYTSGQEIGRVIANRNGFAVTDNQLYYYLAGGAGDGSGRIMTKPLSPGGASETLVRPKFSFTSFSTGTDGRLVYVRRLHRFSIATMRLKKL